MDLKNVNLLDLQTTHMKNDPTTQALCIALNPKFQQLAEDVKKVLIYSNLDNLDEKALDELAWQMDITWYNANADTEIKRSLVKKAIKVFRHVGTPYAVEEVINIYFGDGEVQEWYEYDGEPYMFKVLISNPSVTTDLANQFIEVLNTVKNTRSHLEQIIISLSADLNIFYGGIVHVGDNIQVRQVDK